MNFVYVSSPKFYPYLYISLRSLFSSETSIDEVTIFSVEGKIKNDFKHLPIRVINAPTKSRKYWMLNKTYVCDVKHKSVCFIDTDVIIKGNVKKVGKQGKDIAARRSTAYTLDTYEEEIWDGYLKEKKVETRIPILNTGLLWFRNGIHREIGEEWAEHMHDAWERGFFGNGYHADQWSLPVALGRRGATYSLLGPEDHALAWEGDSLEDATVYHTGASNFFSTIRSMENPDFLDADLPIPRPSVTWNYLKDRIGKRWRTLTSATPKAENQDVWLED